MSRKKGVKQQRTSLTIEEKAEIVRWSEQGKSAAAIVLQIQAKWQKTVDKSTVTKMLKHKDKWKHAAAAGGNLKAKRQRDRQCGLAWREPWWCGWTRWGPRHALYPRTYGKLCSCTFNQ
jgi:hypothetical protein